MKKLKKGIRNLSVITILLSNIGCDQLSKNIARNHIDDGEKISVISNYLTLTKVENSGAFLSVGHNLPFLAKTLLLIVLPSLALMALLIFVLHKNRMGLTDTWPMAFIIGGGIGNLYDRIVNGSVTDFLHMNFHVFQTGIFNMADVSIMIGGVWLLFSLHRRDKLNGSMEIR